MICAVPEVDLAEPIAFDAGRAGPLAAGGPPLLTRVLDPDAAPAGVPEPATPVAETEGAAAAPRRPRSKKRS